MFSLWLPLPPPLPIFLLRRKTNAHIIIILPTKKGRWGSGETKGWTDTGLSITNKYYCRRVVSYAFTFMHFFGIFIKFHSNFHVAWKSISILYGTNISKDELSHVQPTGKSALWSHTQTHTHTHTHTLQTHIHMRMHRQTHTQACARIYIYAQTHAGMHTHVQCHMHTHMHMHSRTHMHPPTQAPTHTHTLRNKSDDQCYLG